MKRTRPLLTRSDAIASISGEASRAVTLSACRQVKCAVVVPRGLAR